MGGGNRKGDELRTWERWPRKWRRGKEKNCEEALNPSPLPLHFSLQRAFSFQQLYWNEKAVGGLLRGGVTKTQRGRVVEVELKEDECEDDAKKGEHPIQRGHSRETDMTRDKFMRRNE